MRYRREFQPDSGQQRLKNRNTDYSLRYRAYGQACQPNKILASLRNETSLYPPRRRDEVRAVEEEEPSEHHRQNKFESSHARTTGKGEHRTG